MEKRYWILETNQGVPAITRELTAQQIAKLDEVQPEPDPEPEPEPEKPVQVTYPIEAVGLIRNENGSGFLLLKTSGGDFQASLNGERKDFEPFGAKTADGQKYSHRIVLATVPLTPTTLIVQQKDQPLNAVQLILTPKPVMSEKVYSVDPVPGPDKPTQEPEKPVPAGEIRALPVKSLSDVPAFTLANGTVNMLATDVDFATQAEWARKGMVNFVHVTKIPDENGGQYDKQWNPTGMTVQQWKDKVASYNLPDSVGIYRMMYDNAVADFWPPNKLDGPSNQQKFNQIVEGYAVGLNQALGWQEHPTILDLDLEDGRFFTYAGVKAMCEAIKYTLKRNKNVAFQVYASGPNNTSFDQGGSEKKPTLMISGSKRFEMLREAGCTYFLGTLPYFKVPQMKWIEKPGHGSEIIGKGKAYESEKEYALKSLEPIREKLRWWDDYAAIAPKTGYYPHHLEWAISVYEGGDDGGEHRYYDDGTRWTSFNWPMVGNWIAESLVIWGYVTGTYKHGGGLYNWSDSRPRLESSDHMEAGKWRAAQFNEFWNNPDTLYNIQLEYTLDGKKWESGNEMNWDFIYQTTNLRPYLRAAFLHGKLLVVGAAGQPYHLKGTTQELKCRYAGKEFKIILEPLKVHTIVQEIGVY